MNFIKISILAIITFLTINSFSNDVFSNPRVKVRVITPRVKVVTIVKTNPVLGDAIKVIGIPLKYSNA